MSGLSRSVWRRRCVVGLIAVVIAAILGLLRAPFWSLYIALPIIVLIGLPWSEEGVFIWQGRRKS